MRWFWIDCFTEFVSRTRATAIKNVTLSEPHVVDYVPSFSQLSQSLVVEGIAHITFCCEYKGLQALVCLDDFLHLAHLHEPLQDLLVF